MTTLGRIYGKYHAMEHAGVFARNPANVNAQDPDTKVPLYKGPVKYPKMLYHPKGEEKVIQPKIVNGKTGEVETPELREIKNVIVYTFEEEERYREEGWLDHPAKALQAAGKPVPPVSPANTIDSLKDEIARLQALLERERSLRGVGMEKPARVMDVAPGADRAKLMEEMRAMAGSKAESPTPTLPPIKVSLVDPPSDPGQTRE